MVREMLTASLLANAKNISYQDIEREAQMLPLTVEALCGEGYSVCWGEDVLVATLDSKRAEALRLLVSAKLLTERAMEQGGVVIVHWRDFEQNVAMTELEDEFWEELMSAAHYIMESDSVCALQA